MAKDASHSALTALGLYGQHSGAPREPFARVAHQHLSVVLAPNGFGTSRGAIIHDMRHIAVAGSSSNDAGHGWVEVMRWFSELGEGVDNYGCWFGAGAAGSGIWLRVGKSVNECDLHGAGKGEDSSIRKAWIASDAVDHGVVAQDAVRALRSPMGDDNSSQIISAPRALWRAGWQRETVTYYAGALGFDTLHCNRRTWGGLTEMIALHPACMRGTLPLGGCARGELGLRAGWMHSMQCTCDEPDLVSLNDTALLPALNCRGVARTGVAVPT
jgi:hypothetical protein